jgi:RecG-like helicase
MFARKKQPVVDTSIAGTTPIAEAQARTTVTITGQVVRMQSRPASDLPTMVISIKDSTGTAIATWTGRRSMGGIALGRRIVITGVATHTTGLLTFVNPEYQLLA